MAVTSSVIQQVSFCHSTSFNMLQTSRCCTDCMATGTWDRPLSGLEGEGGRGVGAEGGRESGWG